MVIGHVTVLVSKYYGVSTVDGTLFTVIRKIVINLCDIFIIWTSN